MGGRISIWYILGMDWQSFPIKGQTENIFKIVVCVTTIAIMVPKQS
jgi:hypothetical protein